MEQFGNVDQLLASLNRLVEEDVEPPPSKDDRIDTIEQSIQAIASSVDEVNQRSKQVVDLCCSQGQLFAKIYNRSEIANKETESQLRDIRKQITHLSSQLQALVQAGSYGGAGAGIHTVTRSLNSFQLSPVSADASRSPITSSSFPAAIAANQAQIPISLPYSISHRNADSAIQPSVSAYSSNVDLSAAPMVTAARSGVALLHNDLSLQARHQQFQHPQQSQQTNRLGLSEPGRLLNHPLSPANPCYSGVDVAQAPQPVSQTTSAQEAALAFFQKHNQRLPENEMHMHALVSDGPGPSATLQPVATLVATSAIASDYNTRDVPPNNTRTLPADKTEPTATPSPALAQPTASVIPKEPISSTNTNKAEEISKPTKPNAKPATTTTGRLVSSTSSSSSSATALKGKPQSTRKEPDLSKYSLSSRSHDRTSHRSRSPPSRRSKSRTDPRDVSPPRNQVTIKGATKHYRANDSLPAESPLNKRRNTSPHITSNTISFLSESGSESGQDIDDLIERRFSNTENSSRKFGKNGMDIGIVGASSSTRGSSYGNGRFASKGEIAISAKPQSRSPVGNRHERGDEHSDDDRIGSSARKHSSDRYVPGSSSQHISSRLSDTRNINFRLDATNYSRSATNIHLRDSNGNVITSEKISRITGPFIFVGTPMISPLYHMFYRCQPLATGVKPDDLNRSITGLDGFKFWPTNFPVFEGSNKTLTFVRRIGPEFDRLRRRMNKRLLGGRYVLGPLLCYYIATLAMTNVKTLTGPLVMAMYNIVMQSSVETLEVITTNSIKRMSADEIAEMTAKWVVGIANYIHYGDRASESLDKADRCYQTYEAQCRNSKGDNDDNMDPSGEIARDMLKMDREKSQLFLGIRSSELQKLYRYLVQMMPNYVPTPTVMYLRQLAESYIDKE